MGMTGISGGDIRLIREQFQQFKRGTFNLQKSDLNDLKTSLGKSASQAGAGVEGLLSSFDQIDTNQDGISFKELVDFTRAQNGGAVPAVGDALHDKERATDEVSGIQGAERRSGKRGGHHGGGFDLPPISVDDLNAYKEKLIKDGKEVPPELDELIASFATIDGDKSGKISFDEVRTYLKQTSPKPEEVSLSKDDLVGLKDKLAQSAQQQSTNLDALISGFGAADSNQDGKIDLEELQKFLKSNAQNAGQETASTVASNEGLGIMASLGKRPADRDAEQPASKASPAFLKKLAVAYNQLTMPVAAGSLQLQA